MKDVNILGSKVLHLIPNMPLDQYKEILSTFDVGLSLMATPHPSMPPLDLALSGCIVVTNSFANKTTETMNNICRNILCSEMTVDDICNTLKKAISMSDDLDLRYENAMTAEWPRNWEETYVLEHRQWIVSIMEGKK